MLAYHGKLTLGSRLQVEVPESAGSLEILTVSFTKQSHFNPHLMRSNDISDYNLVFKSMMPADTVPGTETPLTIKGYHKSTGLSYGHITLVINCKNLNRECELVGL